ncbi:MAG: serine hydrolase [Pseudohongiellaceae bacterium]
MKSASRQFFEKTLFCIATLLLLFPVAVPAQTESYYPPRDSWERRSPQQLGMNPERLAAAVELALQNTVVEPKDMAQMITNSFGREPHFSIIGPVKDREAGSGLVIRHGYIAAEWGDLEREDMTFSVTKSYLSTVAGLAFDDGLIKDPNEPVRSYFDHESFQDPHNAPISWQHLLTQTSDWRGTLFGKPDWADRPISRDPTEAENRPLFEPGTHYKYNDVRINFLSLALLNVWQRPLNEVLKERIMVPIGASDEWQWHGYENSWVEVNGRRMHSVSGGAHWGGGFFISTLDHARFGYLFLRNGNWDGQQLLSQQWIERAVTPSAVNKEYGYLWWLNTDHEAAAGAPPTAFYASGAGGNYIWVDRDNDLLIVLRWIPRMGDVITAITESIESM